MSINNMVQLRSLKLSDAPCLTRMINNKNILDNLKDFIPFPYREEDARSFITLVSEETPSVTFGITYNSGLCGVAGLILEHDIHRHSAKIGYWIGEDFWRKGIATKAVKLLTTYAFEKLKLTRLHSCVMAHNRASMQVLLKNGYIQDAIFKKAIVKNNVIMDEYHFSMLIDDWKKRGEQQ